MKHLSEEWQVIRGKIKSDHLFLFLDFDGTLVPIVRSPEDVVLSESMRGILRALVLEKNISVGIISGRKLADVKDLVNVKGIIYAGNHGFEIEGPDLCMKVPIAPESETILKTIIRELTVSLRSFKGVIVEDKGHTVSVHYRMIEEKEFSDIEKIFKGITEKFLETGQIRVTYGKKVWEVRPPLDWHKGKLVISLLRKQDEITERKILPIYIGDDVTDEDAFIELGDKGYTIKVSADGKEKSRAEYYLKDHNEVEDLLGKILELIENKG